MSVERKFHQVTSDTKGSCGLNQRHEDPPADGSIQNSERDTGYQLLFTRVRFGLKMIQRNKYLLICLACIRDFLKGHTPGSGQIDKLWGWLCPPGLTEESFSYKQFTFLQKPVCHINATSSPSSETQRLLAGTKRYFWAKVYFKSWRALGAYSYRASSRSGRIPTSFPGSSAQSAGRNSTTSGTGSVRISSQGLYSSWSKLSPENIASSRLVAPGSPRMPVA